MCRVFSGTTALAFIHSHQFTLFAIKLFFLIDFPFMKASFTQGIALMFFRSFLFFKGNDLAHWLQGT